MSAPVLVATEMVVVARAIREGWIAEKARAWVSLIGKISRAVGWRRSVQATRIVSDFQVLSLFAAGIETDLIDTGLPRWVNPLMERYRRWRSGCCGTRD